MRAKWYYNRAQSAASWLSGIGRQDAQFIRSALVAGLLTAKGASAATEVARQRVVAGGKVVTRIMGVAPACHGHAVAQLGHGVQPRVGRAAHALEYLQMFELRHHHLPNAVMLRLPIGKARDEEKMRKFVKVWGRNCWNAFEWCLSFFLHQPAARCEDSEYRGGHSNNDSHPGCRSR